MKKAGILLVLLTACLGLPAREVINLNRDWRFFSATAREAATGPRT